MTHVMAYLVLVSAGIGACAVVTELALRTRLAAGRWVWIGALSAVVVATLFVLAVPLPGVREVSLPGSLIQGAGSITTAMPVAIKAATTLVKLADAVLPATWMLVVVTGIASGKRVAFTVRRGDQVASPPHVIVFSSDGKELARGDGLLEKIVPQSIYSVEVFKANQCPATMTCPLIKITLAKGKTLER